MNDDEHGFLPGQMMSMPLLISGILQLLGISYRPALADLPDQKGWRISAGAGYGPLDTFARGRIDTGKIRRNWGTSSAWWPPSTPARCGPTTW